MATRSIPVFLATRAVSARDVLQQAWDMAVVMVRARQTRTLLGEMDDRLLADVGISRGDAIMEAARPFWAVSARRR